MKKIVFCGSILVDSVKMIERWPERGTLVQIRSLARSVGGSVANSGIDLKTLDPSIDVRAIGFAGDDDAGDFYVKTLAEHGIDISGIRRVKDVPTTFTDVMTVAETGERTFFNMHGADSRLKPGDINPKKLDCDIFHFGYLLLLDGMDAPDPEYGTAAARLLAKVQAAGIRTSIDIVSEKSERFRSVVIPALKYCDYVIINEVEGALATGCDEMDMRGICEGLFKAGVRERVVVHCPERSVTLGRLGDYAEVASLELPEGWIKGSVGAGDAFCAGCLYSIMKGLPPDAMLRLGAAAAACNLAAPDSISGAKSIRETLAIAERYVSPIQKVVQYVDVRPPIGLCESPEDEYRQRKARAMDDNCRFPQPGVTAKDDTASVMKHYKLPTHFPKAVLEEAHALSREVTVGRGRLDLRRKFVFTCDPQSARDYDDALSLETDRRGNRVLGVHIADVSHYVRPGSALDREAYRRSTSVYLCDRVVPMLPEELSNGVCSLMPNEDRYAFSVFVTFDKNGDMIGRRFAKSVIRSKARFTYEEVMNVIRGGAMEGADKTIRAISALAQQLRTKRFANGALDLELPEVEPILDVDGELESLVTRPYDESHQMIEECMVAANEAVAKELWTRGIRILSRLHEPPEPERLLMLRSEMRGLGIKMGDVSKPKVFSQFLKSIKSHPLYATLAMMVLRSMKKAVYDSTEIGHFGLAKGYYAHFTSPIRRYPDLTLHRQLAAYLDGKNAKVAPKLLAKWAEYSSEREEMSTEAERQLLEIKKYRVLESQLEGGRRGLEYDAVISKCEPFGCFVDVPELAISGLVHISTLSDRFVRFNEHDQSLSVPGGREWHIGDKLRVMVTSVNMRERKIDFSPVSVHRRRGRFGRRG